MTERVKTTKNSGIIGIVGGVGPYAGLDLNRKIFDHTIARSDQDHLPVLLASLSDSIGDRTRFLLDGDIENPSDEIFNRIQMLSNAGATVIGIPCNTAHAAPIFSDLQRKITQAGLHLKLLHMIREVCRHLRETYPKQTKVGVLSTLGTYKTGLYKKRMEREGIQMLDAGEMVISRVHFAIYDPDIGIKAKSNPVTREAREIVLDAVRILGQQGADVVILGCTELPIAVPELCLDDVDLIDPASILSRALIREIAPTKLKPLE